MGICISVASSEIHRIPQVHDENVMIFEANKVQYETKRLCSVYSKQGTKGLNQDAASLYQVCLSIMNNLHDHEILTRRDKYYDYDNHDQM